MRNAISPGFTVFTTGHKTDFRGNQQRDNLFVKAATIKIAEAPKMYATENDISLQRLTELNTLMNQRLADALDLQIR